MGFVSIDKEVSLERYTMCRYLLNVPIDNKKYMINDSAYEVITRLDGTRTYGELIKELACYYNDDEKHVEETVKDLFTQLENGFSIRIEHYDEKTPKRIEVTGEFCYYPKVATLEITEACNLKCIHCYGDFGSRACHAMKLEDIKKVMDDLDEMGITAIELTGGDITTYPHLKEVIEYSLSKSFVKVNLLTNGILLTEDIMRLVVENKERMAIQIDLHSLRDEYLLWFTKASNTLDTIKKNIEFFSSHGVIMRVATIFTSRNIEEFEAIGEWVGSRGIKWGVGLVDRLGRAVENDGELYLDASQMQRFVAELTKYSGKYPGTLSLIDYHPNDQNCGAMTSQVVFNSRGEIKLCTMDNRSYFNNEMGNVFEKKVSDIYDDKIEVVKALTMYQLPDNSSKECTECGLFVQCSNCVLKNFINMKESGFKCKWYQESVPDIMKQHFFG